MAAPILFCAATAGSNSGGSGNTFVGRSAGKANATGFGNTFLGRTSGAAHLSGDNNTFVGRNSGSLATTGFRNAALGHNVGPSLDGLTNSTAHGSEAQVAQSNALVLGGIGPNAVNVGIGTSAPNASVALNITSASKGALLPRRAETARLGIGSPAPSLLLVSGRWGTAWLLV